MFFSAGKGDPGESGSFPVLGGVQMVCFMDSWTALVPYFIARVQPGDGFTLKMSDRNTSSVRSSQLLPNSAWSIFYIKPSKVQNLFSLSPQVPLKATFITYTAHFSALTFFSIQATSAVLFHGNLRYSHAIVYAGSHLWTWFSPSSSSYN